MFKRLTGERPQSGISFPDVVKVAEAYGIAATRNGYNALETGVQTVLEQPRPGGCDFLLDPDQPFEPRVFAKQFPDGRIVSFDLGDMSRLLDKQEPAENMMVPFDRP